MTDNINNFSGILDKTIAINPDPIVSIGVQIEDGLVLVGLCSLDAAYFGLEVYGGVVLVDINVNIYLDGKKHNRCMGERGESILWGNKSLLNVMINLDNNTIQLVKFQIKLIIHISS